MDIVSEYKMRIIIPITYNNIIVSFQARDVTERKNTLRYKTASKKEETYFHKHCLYGLDHLKDEDKIIVVEGVTKVWRLGKGAVATFGTSWTLRQAFMMKKFKTVFILFDKGEEAQKRATDLSYLLSSNVNHVEVLELEEIEDPGDLSENEAKYLMKQLGF